MRTLSQLAETDSERTVDEMRKAAGVFDDDPKPEELTEQQVMAISCLMECPSMTAAADKCGVNVRTLRRWMQNPLFMSEFNKMRRQDLDQITANLLDSAKEAVAVLKLLLKSPDPSIQLRAAKIILQASQKSVETAEVNQKIDEQEKTIKNQRCRIRALNYELGPLQGVDRELAALKQHLRWGTFTRPDWLPVENWNQLFRATLKTK